ncbi:transcription intermediary factor 1-alpha [Xiphias gladius]|uniref:transcription intermediary factor 1-alpha n=1 Tax=Xiphias gladius TaxID=8245 RepID=UPI001A98BD22|nr:transcription intermediary factor 1-alpha [Xiphias gladius]
MADPLPASGEKRTTDFSCLFSSSSRLPAAQSYRRGAGGRCNGNGDGQSSFLNMETTGDPENSLSSQQCCSRDPPSSRCWCLDCKEALCDECVLAHRRVTVTRSHTILNHPPGNVLTSPIKFCRLHPCEPLKLFCFTCYQYTCRDCQLMSHMNHRHQFVSEALGSLKKQLEAWVQPIIAQRDTVRRSLQDMQTRLQELVQGESQLKTELQESYKICAQLLKKRMEDILDEVKVVSESEREHIQRRMVKLKQLQRGQLLVTETTEKTKNINDLPALLSWSQQIEFQLKNLDQDPSPPQTMSQMQVITDRKSLETLLNFGELKVSWIPFSVSRASTQNTPATSTSTSSPAVTPPAATCPALSCKTLPHTGTTNDTASPVPVNHPSLSSKSSSSKLCCPPPSTSHPSNSSSVVPPTSTCPAPSSRPPLTQTRTASDTLSPVSGSCPSVSLQFSSAQLSPPPYFCPNLSRPVTPLTTSAVGTSAQPVKPLSSSPPRSVSHLKTYPSQVVPLMNHVQPVPTSVSQQPVSSPASLWAGLSPSCSVLKLVQPSLVPNQPAAPHLNHPAAVLLTNPQAVYQVSCWPISRYSVLPQLPLLLSQTMSQTLPGNTFPKQQKRCGLMKNFIPRKSGKQQTHCGLMKNQVPGQCRKQPTYFGLIRNFIPRKSGKRQKRCGRPRNTSPGQRQLQSLVKAVPDSACDISVPQVTARQQEPAEDKATSTVSEETEPAGKLSLPETRDRHTEESSPVIGQQDRRLNQRQPRVSLFRLPLSLLRPGRPLPGFSPPAENKLTSTTSVETEPAGNRSLPETKDRHTEESSPVIGQQDRRLSQRQPRVSLFRLPLSLLRPGRPLPGFNLIPGDTEDEVYLEEMDEDSQSQADDVSDVFGDFTEPLSSPESPVTLQIVSCCACGSAYSSIICLSCGRGYHRDCHIPPVGPDIWTEWICSLCQDLSDPSDPYSSERPQSPQSPCLNLLDQRRCETLLLHLKVEGCSRLSETGCVWSHLMSISERLTLRRSPPYQTAAELISDIWSLFKETPSSQDQQVLNKLQQSFQTQLMETFSLELRPSLLTPTNTESGEKPTDLHQRHPDESKLKEMRERLRAFLDLRGPSGARRTKKDRMAAAAEDENPPHPPSSACFRVACLTSETSEEVDV